MASDDISAKEAVLRNYDEMNLEYKYDYLNFVQKYEKDVNYAYRLIRNKLLKV